MTKAEVIECFEKHDACIREDENNCLKRNCTACPNYILASKKNEAIREAIDLLKKKDGNVCEYEEATDEFSAKVSKDVEYFAEKVKSQVYDLVLEVERFAERMKSND